MSLLPVFASLVHEGSTVAAFRLRAPDVGVASMPLSRAPPLVDIAVKGTTLARLAPRNVGPAVTMVTRLQMRRRGRANAWSALMQTINAAVPRKMTGECSWVNPRG
jgi:hypothetical protein